MNNATIDYLSRLISIYPNNPVYYFERADILFDLEKYDFALQDYLTAFDFGFENADTIYLIGLCYDRLQDKENAIKLYSVCLAVDKDYTLAHNNLGLIYFEKGMLDKAKQHFIYAMKSDSHHYRSRNNLGLVYGVQEKYGKAIQAFSEAIQINAKYDKAYVNRAHAYIEMLELDLAQRDLDLIINELNPFNDEAYFHRGVLNKLLHKPEEAFKDLQKSIEINPHKATAFVELGEIATMSSLHETAIILFKKAIEIDPIFSIKVISILSKYMQKENNKNERIQFKSSLEEDHYQLKILPDAIRNELGRIMEIFITAETAESLSIIMNDKNKKMIEGLIEHHFFDSLIERSFPIARKLNRNLQLLKNIQYNSQ